jgi:hypothetical protein
MEIGIHEFPHGEGDVFDGKGCAVGKEDAFAKFEGDGLPAVLNFPGAGQFRLQLLRLAIKANQVARGEITDGFGGIIIREHGIERLGFGLKAKAKFAAGLRAGGGDE